MQFARSFDDVDWYELTGATLFGIPEGTAEEWRSAIDCIRRGIGFYAKRLGVVSSGAWFEISSPRNSCGPGDHYVLFDSEAEWFCSMVEAELARYDTRLSEGAGI